MRSSTTVHWSLESVGRPEHSTSGKGTIREVTLAIAAWLLVVPMGHKIRIIIARDEADLKDRRSAAKLELMDELESLLGGTPENEESTDGHS
jgi:hypothetical protein